MAAITVFSDLAKLISVPSRPQMRCCARQYIQIGQCYWFYCSSWITPEKLKQKSHLEYSTSSSLWEQINSYLDIFNSFHNRTTVILCLYSITLLLNSKWWVNLSFFLAVSKQFEFSLNTKHYTVYFLDLRTNYCTETASRETLQTCAGISTSEWTDRLVSAFNVVITKSCAG